MIDVLILEDHPRKRIDISKIIPQNTDHRFVVDGLELENFLATGEQARLYFLDDEVPDSLGIVDFYFIKHSLLVRAKHPDAKIFYIGSVPYPAEREHCARYNMELITRDDIGTVIARELLRD